MAYKDNLAYLLVGQRLYVCWLLIPTTADTGAVFE